MQEVHLTCPWDSVLPLLHAFEKQFEQVEEVAVLDWGWSYKQVHGYIVLEWDDEVSQAFIDQLDADSHVLDFCVYSVLCSDQNPLDDALPTRSPLAPVQPRYQDCPGRRDDLLYLHSCT